MTRSSQLSDDLGFVRSAVERSEGALGPRSISLFWALAVLVGMPLGDFAPEHLSRYWMIVGPLGWVVSAVLGALHARRSGQLDLRRGWAQAAHFGFLVVAISLLALLAREGHMPWYAMGPLAVLLLALTYGLAGVHFHRMFFVPAALFAAGYGVLLWVDAWPWTVVGVLAAVGLLFTAWIGGERDAALAQA